MSDSLWPHGLQHARAPCPSPAPKLAQTHVHRVGDAIQPSHPLFSPSPPTFNLSQFQGLFQWVSSLHQMAQILNFQLQHQSFQWIFRTDFLKDGIVWSPCNPGDSQESSPTPQFRSINSSVLSFLYIIFNYILGLPGGSNGKESVCCAGSLGSIPGSGRFPGEGKGYSLQCSFLKNPMDRGDWWVTVRGVTKSWTGLSS